MNPQFRFAALISAGMSIGAVVFAQDEQADLRRRVQEARANYVKEMAQMRQQQGGQAFVAPTAVSGPSASAGPATKAAVSGSCDGFQAVVESWKQRRLDALQRMAKQLDSAVKSAARYNGMVRREPSGDEERDASIAKEVRASLQEAGEGLHYGGKLLSASVDDLRDEQEVKQSMRQEPQSNKIASENWDRCFREFEVPSYVSRLRSGLESDKNALLPKIEANFNAVKAAFQQQPNFAPLTWTSLETQGRIFSYVQPGGVE